MFKEAIGVFKKGKGTNFVCSNYKQYLLKHMYFTFTI